ncbi:unnamed protein product [Adineta ricciae]|uniref:F-box domain-containing protein n=1 Tax=Adineta ricciae TaxID=249248 RepID=A0A815JRF5_ADIRI|nr:unnamed protein product [Adineta ricciae]
MSKATRSCFEDLANELLLEIFDYLDWINLFSAFYGLTKRINHLVTCINTLSIYSNYLINQSNIVYLCFQEFPLTEFKQIQHFKLLYDNPYDESLNIAKYFSSFRTLISLHIDANVIEDGNCTNEFLEIIFHQNCPFLQRLYLHGNVFDQDLKSIQGVCTFHFPSLLHIHVTKLPFRVAIQLLDQCSRLHSFSAMLYDYPTEENVTALASQMPESIRVGLPTLTNLSLGEKNRFHKESTSTFLEFLLPRCPNLRTFHFDIHCNDNGDCEKILHPDWWKYALRSNSHLAHIDFRLSWWTRHIIHNGYEKIQRFRESPFFNQLNTTMTHTFNSEFMRSMDYELFIKN